MDHGPGRIRKEVPVLLLRPREEEQTEYTFFRRNLYKILSFDEK